MGAGDKYLNGVPTNSITKLTCCQEEYEVRVGVRCDYCRKEFANRRRKGDFCKCPKA